MAIKTEFIWYTINGSPITELGQWLATLSIEEQQEFAEADRRQKSYRQDKIDSGDMILAEDGSYIWKDQTTAEIGKETDPTWAEYFERWQQETDMRLKIVQTEI